MDMIISSLINSGILPKSTKSVWVNETKFSIMFKNGKIIELEGETMDSVSCLPGSIIPTPYDFTYVDAYNIQRKFEIDTFKVTLRLLEN